VAEHWEDVVYLPFLDFSHVPYISGIVNAVEQVMHPSAFCLFDGMAKLLECLPVGGPSLGMVDKGAGCCAFLVTPLDPMWIGDLLWLEGLCICSVNHLVEGL